MNTAILFGATGLVGGHLLRQLLESPAYSRVVTVGRKKVMPEAISANSDKLTQVVFDLESWVQGRDAHDELNTVFAGADIFYAMGTTIAQAKSKEAFRRIDFEYPVAIASIAKMAGAMKWVMVTSVGAAARSPFFYLRVKGESEAAIAKVGFEATHFFRPSFLLGKRSDERILEKYLHPLARECSVLFSGPLIKYRAIEASEVARQMIEATASQKRGVQIHEGKNLFFR